MSPKANRPPREVLLWVTPASGWLPIFLPETAGPPKPPGVQATGLRSTRVSFAKGVSSEHFLDQQPPVPGVRQEGWGWVAAREAPLGLGGAREAPASLSQAPGTGTGSGFHIHTHTHTGKHPPGGLHSLTFR